MSCPPTQKNKTLILNMQRINSSEQKSIFHYTTTTASSSSPSSFYRHHFKKTISNGDGDEEANDIVFHNYVYPFNENILMIILHFAPVNSSHYYNALLMLLLLLWRIIKWMTCFYFADFHQSNPFYPANMISPMFFFSLQQMPHMTTQF